MSIKVESFTPSEALEMFAGVDWVRATFKDGSALKVGRMNGDIMAMLEPSALTPSSRRYSEALEASADINVLKQILKKAERAGCKGRPAKEVQVWS